MSALTLQASLTTLPLHQRFMSAAAGAQLAKMHISNSSTKSSTQCCQIAAVKLQVRLQAMQSRQPDGGWRHLSTGVAPKLATSQSCSEAVRQPTCVHSGHTTAFSKLMSHPREVLPRAPPDLQTQQQSQAVEVFTVLAAAECSSVSCAVASFLTSQTALVCGRASISSCPHAGCAVRRQRCMSAAVRNLETLCAAASGTSKHLESCKTLSLKHQSSPRVPGRLRIRCTAGCAAVRTAVECAWVSELAALVLERSWIRLIHLLQPSHRVWRAARAIRAG